ncbi:MAG: MFS transporter [Syntrophaceae bacterium]
MEPGSRKQVFAWAMYDWANSAFATTVMAGFFPIFFKQFWSAGTDTAISTARLGLANSLAGIVVALAAPVLGAIADRSGAKKRFLVTLAFLGIAATLSLSFVSKGHWAAASILYALSFIGFAGGNVFYDSLLKTVAGKNDTDSVSALGFSLGYLGGGILFALNVWMTLKPQMFGLAGPADAVRLSFLTVGTWWAVFTLPLMIVVREDSARQGPRRPGMVGEGLRQLVRTFHEVRHLKAIFLFLSAYWLYIDGVDTIIVMAVDYGLSLGFHQEDLIVALLITQFVGFPCAMIFGRLAGLMGTKRSILLAITVYLFVTIWAAFIRTRAEFYVMAVLIGTVQGGVQALSRSFYARLIPVDKAAQYFGFYNMLGKFAAIIGPVMVGATAVLSRSLGAGAGLAPRLSIASIMILFLAGGVLLVFVDEKKGMQEAEFL